jgi:hypothetical protein
MKSIGMLPVVLVFLLALAQSAIAQEPTLDLEITDLSYACVSPGIIYLEAEVQLAATDSVDSSRVLRG